MTSLSYLKLMDSNKTGYLYQIRGWNSCVWFAYVLMVSEVYNLSETDIYFTKKNDIIFKDISDKTYQNINRRNLMQGMLSVRNIS